MDRYISDEHVIINVQGLRTVKREDSMPPGFVSSTTGHYYLTWSYKGMEHSHRYPDQAARDAMYDALRAALTAEKERKQMKGSYSRLEAAETAHEFFARIRFDLSPLDAEALVEALEPIMRSGGSDAV